MPLSPFVASSLVVRSVRNESPLALFCASAQGIAQTGTPLKVAVLAVFDAYGLDATLLEIDDVAGHSLASLHKPAAV